MHVQWQPVPAQDIAHPTVIMYNERAKGRALTNITPCAKGTGHGLIPINSKLLGTRYNQNLSMGT